MMNPGVTEEVGATTRSFFEAMKQSPTLLAMIIANFGLICFMFFALKYAAEFRTSLINQNFEYQKSISEILSRCVVPVRP
jgi:hypothetical protein